MGIGYIYARITEALLEGESILRVIIKHLEYYYIISGFLACGQILNRSSYIW